MGSRRLLRLIAKITAIMTYILVILLLFAASISTITGKPFLMTVIRSNSMIPKAWQGDIVFVAAANRESLKQGDIIIFKAYNSMNKLKGWVMHRITGGNPFDGYITKGDNNESTDQYSGDQPVKPERIFGRPAMIGQSILRVPYAGYISLGLGSLNSRQVVLPVIAILLAVVIIINEFFFVKHGVGRKAIKKKRRSDALTAALVYLLCGLTISIVTAATILSSSYHITLEYEVSNTSRGVIMGSDIGILKMNDVFENPLTEINNKGFFPLFITISSDDSQIAFTPESETVVPGQVLQTSLKLTASTVGSYHSSIWIGLFYPFLPKGWIYAMARISFWFALAAVSAVPAVPLVAYPFINPSIRKKLIWEIRHKFIRMKNAFSLPRI